MVIPFKKTDYPDDFNSQNAVGPVVFFLFLLMFVVIGLLASGLLMLYSASFSTVGQKYFSSQSMWMGIGVIGGMIAFAVGYRRLASISWIWIALAAILLFLALFFPEVNGARRWIRIRVPGMMVSLQPSEFAKIAIALFISKYTTDYVRSFNNLSSWFGIFLLGAPIGIIFLLILVGGDVGTILLLFIMVLLTLIAAGLWKRYYITALIVAVIFGCLIYSYNDVRRARVTAFLHPEEYKETISYQLWYSLMAFGSGGMNGVGFLESRLKAQYLPESHTDFILAIVGEEFGWIGMLVVIVGYSLFAISGVMISLRASDPLGMLVGYSLTLGIVLQGLINLAVAIGTFPTTGMPAPFISYGGSNMVSNLISVGILASVAYENIDNDYNSRWLLKMRRRLSALPVVHRFIKGE